jgi:hypothetical protein
MTLICVVVTDGQFDWNEVMFPLLMESISKLRQGIDDPR